MKKIIPVLIAIVLIIIIVGVSFGRGIMEKYSYSQEKADLNKYFGIAGDEAAIIMQNEVIEDRARVSADGTFYITYDTVSDYFIYTRLYVNEEENTIRYVLPDRILSYNREKHAISRETLSGCLRYSITRRFGSRTGARSTLLMGRGSLWRRKRIHRSDIRAV